MNIDTHGYMMRGLGEASRRTANWMANYGCDGRTQICYDTAAQRVLTQDLTGTSWTMLDAHVIYVCETAVHMTQQEIADAVADAMATGTARTTTRKMRLNGLSESCASIPNWSHGGDGKPIGQTLVCYDPDADLVFLRNLVGARFDEDIGYSCIVVAGITSSRLSEEEVENMICRAVAYRRAVGWPHV